MTARRAFASVDIAESSIRNVAPLAPQIGAAAQATFEATLVRLIGRHSLCLISICVAQRPPGSIDLVPC